MGILQLPIRFSDHREVAYLIQLLVQALSSRASVGLTFAISLAYSPVDTDLIRHPLVWHAACDSDQYEANRQQKTIANPRGGLDHVSATHRSP